MHSSGRSEIAVAAVLAAVAVGILAVQALYPGLTGTSILRIALVIYAVGFLGVAAMYATDGYLEQALGHSLAGIGFLVVAVGVEGASAWVGVGLLAFGGGILLRDALGRDGRRRTSV